MCVRGIRFSAMHSELISSVDKVASAQLFD